jgi:hypothetical protein
VPRYFFDIVFGSGRIADQDGIELPNAELAHEHALAELRALLNAQTVAMLDPSDCIMEVLNADCKPLFKVPCGDAYDRPKERPAV